MEIFIGNGTTKAVGQEMKGLGKLILAEFDETGQYRCIFGEVIDGEAWAAG